MATITVGSLPYGVAVTPNSAYAFVPNEGSDTVSVMTASPTVSISPAGTLNMDVGQPMTFSSFSTGGAGTLSYQWYLNGNKVGSNSASYSYTAVGPSDSVYCTVTDTASVTSSSNTVTVNVATLPTVSIAPAGPLTIDAGQSSDLHSYSKRRFRHNKLSMVFGWLSCFRRD